MAAAVPAHEQIRNLLYTYAERMDAGDFQGLAELFRGAAMCDIDGNEIARDVDGVLAMYRDGTQLYDGSPCTRHITANSIIDVDEDGGTATARSTYVVFQGPPALPLQPIIGGRYEDRFDRDGDGTWRWSERRFAVDQVGDLSRHLTYALEAQ